MDYIYEAKVKKIEHEKNIILEAMNDMPIEEKINYKKRL